LIDHAQVMAYDEDGSASSITGGFSYGRRGEASTAPPPAPPRYPLPDHLLGPVGHLLAAFDEPTVIGVTVTCEKGEYDGEEYWVVAYASLASGEGIGGFAISLTQPVAQLLEQLADGIQEHLSEQRSTWGQARPPCPGHLHPASVRVHDGVAWWECPRERRPLRPVVPADAA
jgi:hypothetical protein